MKFLGDLDLAGNGIHGVSEITDVNGYPISGGQNFTIYDSYFDSTSVVETETEVGSDGNTIYYKTITIEGSQHSAANPIVQVFEVDESFVCKSVNVDIEINALNDVTIKFVSDYNGDVPAWSADTVNYMCRIFGFAVSTGSGSGSGSGSGNGE